MSEVKYGVVMMAFVLEDGDDVATEPCFLTIWPGGSVELEQGAEDKRIGAARVYYRWREVRDPRNPRDLAGEALAVVLNLADDRGYQPGEYEGLPAWHRARVYFCRHGHDPARCSICAPDFLPEGEDAES